MPILLAAAAPGLSQTAQPVERHAAGLALLHIHLIVRNTDAQRSFWPALMGGTPPVGGRGLRVGGTSVSIQQGESNGGSDGTAMDHVAFRVKNPKETSARLEAAGGKVNIVTSSASGQSVWAIRDHDANDNACNAFVHSVKMGAI